MFPFEQKTTPGLYAAIAISVVIVFIIDLYTPLGIAVWVIYFVPLTLSFFTWRPLVPVALAVLASILMAIDFLIDPNPVGISPKLAGVNRGIDILTVWIVAGVGHLFIRSKLAVRREEWLQAGQVGLTEKMSGELRLEQLGENVLRFLAEYLDAQAGAFFVENGDAFRRCGAYAAPADSGTPELFRPGDGLLGQAVKDGRGFLIHDVPEGYLYFGSSLGQSRPRHLLIAPVKADGAVNAVLELGFIKKAGAAHTELLERVSQSIGVAVRSAKYRARLQELLEETQCQAEELQAQSEELRTTNVELEEQSRALKESQPRLELQQSELEQTNAQLEEQTQILEAQRDDLSGAQGALQAQAQALERASRYKSEFLANMSHELRTPLNSSLILARLLADNRDGNLTPEQVKFAENILSSGNDLLALINDILDLSKIEAGRVEAHIETAPISQLMENLRRTFQPIAEQKGLEFRTQVAPGAPEEVQTDPLRLEQVLKNLLSNALKFTEKGEVVLEVSRAAEGRLAFSVRDTGIGIPEEQQQVIFEAFRQADGTTNRRYGGTGLGLSISRELAGLLGGEIRVSNAIKFTPKGGRVELSVERDSEGIRIIVSDTGKGIEPEFLPHVFDRFRQADSSSTRRHGGLGLGLALVKSLVELHGGEVKAESEGKGRGSTFTVMLPPAIKSVIAAVETPALASFAGAASGGRTEGSIPIPDGVTIDGVRVLAVDDQEEARVTLSYFLGKCGAVVTTASSAAEALAFLSDHPGGERPDVLVCDIAMPGEDGYSALRRVRALEHERGVAPSQQIPAIALTAMARSEDRLQALSAGFKMHVSKPVEPAELVIVIASVVGQQRHGATFSR